MKPVITWILVADGAQARVLENRGPGKGLTQVKGLAFEDAHLRARDINADRPGRSISSVGSGRSAIEPPTDPVAYREAAFVRSLAEVLEERHEHGAYSRLIIAADPTALGTIREALCPQVRKAILAEMPKDLTNVPTSDMDRHFADMLAV
jgi:protein required for attachment to host cells